MTSPAIIFPGQGSQYAGMGKKLYNESPGIKRMFDEASEIINFDIRKFCCETGLRDLYKTEDVQPSILTMDVAMFQLYMEQIGLEPVFLAGHSLGEIAALVCSGAIRFTEAVKLARYRGLLMKETVNDNMIMTAVIGLDKNQLYEKCMEVSNKDKSVYISLYNSPEQNVVCGDKEAVLELCRKIENKSVKIIPLKINAPFHSPFMKKVADRFLAELKQYKFKPMKYTVIANSTALPYTDEKSICENLYTHLLMPVKWNETLKFMMDNGINTVLEVGPNSTLTNMAAEYGEDIKFYSYDKDINKIKSSFEINKEPKLNILKQYLAIIVCTPNNNWDENEYNNGVVKPYKRIEQIVDTLEKRKEEPTSDQIREAIAMLKLVFKTKGTPQEEQDLRFRQLSDKAGFSAGI